MTVDLDQALAFLRAREERRREALRQRHARACQDAARIVDTLAVEGRPSRIYQWGSLLRPERFSDFSDIDLALEGVTDPADFHRLCALAERLTEFPLDIVQIERIEPEFASSIRERGRIVYEREQ